MLTVSRARYGFLAVVAIALLTAVAVWLMTTSAASAHHPTYSANATCFGWSASATYVGGTGRRLILISEVRVNGVDYAASWSNSGPNPPPNDSGDGGTPVGTNGVIAYNSYGGSKPAAMGDAAKNFVWVGVDDGFTIFQRGNPPDFVPGAANWSGKITQYQWNGSSWVQGGGTPSQVLIGAPTAPTNCATLTVNKVCDPAADPGLFNLQIDGNTAAADAPCGGATGAVQVSVGAHTVGETGGTGTALGDYVTTIGGDCTGGGSVSLAAGENKTCTITNVRKIEADPKITAVVVDCPDAVQTGEAFTCQVDVTVHNNGPTTPVAVDIETTLQSPFDCSKTPSGSQATSRILVASTSQVVSFVWSVTCTEHSFHMFPADSVLTLSEPGVVDPVVTNNTGNSQDTTTISALTDVKVAAVAGTAPASVPANTAFNVQVDVSIHNNGPVSPVKIEGGAGIAAPGDCSTLPGNYQLFNVNSLTASATIVVTKNFTVTCTQGGAHEIVVCGRAGPQTLHVNEASTYSNFKSTPITVNVDGDTPPRVPTVGCSILGDPPEACGNGVDDDGDTEVDEEPDTDLDGQSDCVDTDDDGDGFTDSAEDYIGTDAQNHCPRALFDSAWPVDMNNNRVVNISDVLALKPAFGNSVPPTSPRFDLVPSGSINISDVLAMKAPFGKSCTP